MIHGSMQLSVQHNRPNKDCQHPLHTGCCFVPGVTGGIVTLWYFAFDYNGTPLPACPVLVASAQKSSSEPELMRDYDALIPFSGRVRTQLL